MSEVYVGVLILGMILPPHHKDQYNVKVCFCDVKQRVSIVAILVNTDDHIWRFYLENAIDRSENYKNRQNSRGSLQPASIA